MLPSKIIELALVLSSSWILQKNVWCELNLGQTNWMPNEDSWHYWWSYSGVSGPAYWGLLNLDWSICDKGRQQSPIDIETKTLVYDPQLGPLRIDNNLISGLLYNDGHSVMFNASMPFFLENLESTSHNDKNKKHNSSISKRNSNNNLEIFSQLNSLIEAGSDSRKDSTSVSKDLGSSEELSIKQSDKLEPIDSKIASNSVVDGENESDSIDTNSGNYRNQLEDPSSRVHFNGAGLAYPYKFEALYLKFGLDSKSGSEHRINSHAYAAELQLMAYNSLLYKSYAEASNKPRGLVGVAILIDTMPSKETSEGVQRAGSGKAHRLNSALEVLLSKSSELKHRGSFAVIRNLNLSALLPETDSFVAYDGSLTTPGCQESVNWLVINKPLYITQSNLDILRSISADELSSDPTGTLIADNIRPVQFTNYRHVRTNIRPSSGSRENPETCQRLWTRYEYRQAGN